MYDVASTNYTHSDELYDDNHNDKLVEGRNECSKPPQKYAAGCTVRFIGEGNNVKYFTRCYSYIPVDDPVKHPNYIT